MLIHENEITYHQGVPFSLVLQINKKPFHILVQHKQLYSSDTVCFSNNLKCPVELTVY